MERKKTKFGRFYNNICIKLDRKKLGNQYAVGNRVKIVLYGVKDWPSKMLSRSVGLEEPMKKDPSLVLYIFYVSD